MRMDARHARFIVALVATVLLSACSQNTGPFKTQREVTKTQADAEKRVIDAQAYLDLVNSQYNTDVVNAYVRARANDPRNASTAATNHADARRLRAEAKRKLADAQFAVDTAKAESGYDLAKAQCNVLAGTFNSCRDEATARYDSAMASARTRKDAALPPGRKNG